MDPFPAKPDTCSDPLYLAIDQGGQSSRVLVFDRAGKVEAAKVVAVSTSRPRSQWVEHDPSDLLESIWTGLAATATDLGGRVADIQAAGLATQRSSVICWDRSSGEPLSPVLSWQDRRGEALIHSLQCHGQEIRAITGLVISSHYGASKIRWCLDQLPAAREALAQDRLACGPLASYLLFHLCDERPFVVDPAVAARTLLWDPETLDWSTRLLELFGVPRAVLPECVPSRRDFGRLQMPEAGVPLTISMGDQSAAFFAGGVPPSDVALVNLGTGAFIQRRLTSELVSDSRLLSSIVWQDGLTTIKVLEGSINGCGSAVETMGLELGFDADSIHTHADAWLSRHEPPPLFLNGVSGLGSPYWVADYPTQVVGSGEPWQVMVAVFESILFLVRINLEEMTRELGSLRGIHLTGGLSASSSLCQRLADLTGIETERSRAREATARGLAWLLADPLRRGRFKKRAADRFVPRRDLVLEARFRQWRDALEARLSTPSTAVT